MNMVLVLSVLCLVFQVLLVIGWASVSSRLRSWSQTLQKGWTPEEMSSLEEKLPLMCNQAQKSVVSWKGSPRLKISSDHWLTKGKIEEERGQSMTQLFGLTAIILLGSVLESVSTTGSDDLIVQVLAGIALVSLGLSWWIGQHLTRSIVACRLALDTACPGLPSADNVTRDVMEQLQKQMNLLRNGQKQ